MTLKRKGMVSTGAAKAISCGPGDTGEAEAARTPRRDYIKIAVSGTLIVLLCLVHRRVII